MIAIMITNDDDNYNGSDNSNDNDNDDNNNIRGQFQKEIKPLKTGRKIKIHFRIAPMYITLPAGRPCRLLQAILRFRWLPVIKQY